jgi:hypothetical protein
MWIRGETLQQRVLKRMVGDVNDKDNLLERNALIAAWVNSIDLREVRLFVADIIYLGKNTIQQELVADISLKLIRRWAKNDVYSASAWVQQLPAGSLKQDAMAEVAKEWVNKSLSEAMDWGRGLSEHAEKQAVLFAVTNEAVQMDPVAALRLAADLPADERWRDLVQRSAAEWAINDGEQAMAWACQIEHEPLRNQVLASMVAMIGGNVLRHR